MNPPTLSRLFVVATSALLSVVALEIALRLITGDEYTVWPPHLETVFRPRPDLLPGITGESRFRIDARGLRARRRSSGDRFRILVIGGSTTECLYLDQTETWSHLLEAGLNRGLDDAPVWIGNAGRSGLRLDHHLLQLPRLLDELPEIDLVVAMLGANDLHRALVHGSDASTSPGALLDQAFAVHPGRDARLPFPERTQIGRRLARLLRRLETRVIEQPEQDEKGLVYQTWRARRAGAERIRATLPDLTQALETYARGLDRFIDEADARDVHVALVTQPSLWRADLPPELENLLWLGSADRPREYYAASAMAEAMSRFNTTLLEVCARRDIPCLDLADQLPRDTRSFYDDLHFNEEGARRVAAAIQVFLQQNVLVDVDRARSP